MTPAAPPRRSRVRIAALATLLAVLTSLAVSGSAAAQEPLTTKELGLTVRAGYADDVAVTGWSPVEVRLAPTRLFGGTLAVLTDTDVSSVLEERSVEVAAGTEKVYRFIVPPAGQVQVRIAESGREALTIRTNAIGRPSTSFLVGVLRPNLPAGLPPAAAVGTESIGTYGAIDPAWLDISPKALDTVSTLVVRASDLAELGETAARNLRSAVTNGLELVVIADAAGPIDLAAAGLPWNPATAAATATVTIDGQGATQSVLGLTPGPDAWSLTAADLVADAEDTVLIAAVNAGRGRVSVAGVDLGGSGLAGDARLWGHVLQPAAHTVQATDHFTALARPVSLAGEAIRSQGLSLPSLPWLTVFLIAFVLLVGPLNGFVLRRIGRPELAWVTIPAITLVFAAGAYAGARGAQPPLGLAASTSWWIDGQGEQMTVSAIRSPRQGAHTVSFAGDDWAVLPGTRSGTPSRVDRTDGDSNVTMELGALQVGTVLGWRHTDEAPPLDVTATATGSDLVVRVTNRGPVAVEDVVVHAGTRTQRLGDIAAGATNEVAIDLDAPLPVLEPWRDDFDGLRDFRDGRLTPPRSLEAVLRWTVLDNNPGLTWVVGHRASSGTPLPEADGATQDLGELIAVAVRPDLTDADALGPAVVTRTPLLANDANQGTSRPSPTSFEGQGQAILRYRLPGGVAVGALVSSLDRGANQGEFFPEAPGGAIPLVPECPPDARCELDGELFEVCRTLPAPEGETSPEECTITVISPNADGPMVGAPGGLQLEIYDHSTRTWEFATQVIERTGEALTFDPERFLGPLGDVFVRVRGGMFPFDFSGRGLGATIGGTA